MVRRAELRSSFTAYDNYLFEWSSLPPLISQLFLLHFGICDLCDKLDLKLIFLLKCFSLPQYIDCLWEQIQKMRSEQWTEKHLARPYLAFTGALNEAMVHSLPLIPLPPHHVDYRYPKPRVVFRMFDYTDCPEGLVLPGSHSIERFLIEDHVNHILTFHHNDRKEW